MDRQIKKIIDNGAFALDEVPPEELEKNLLYYVASSTTSGEHTKEIKEAFNLKDIMPDTQAVEQARADLTAPNAALMETVSTVIVEDINNIKDKLDVYVRADEKDLSMLESVHGSLTQMADTLAMLNLGVQREAVLKQAEVINGIVSGNLTAEETELMNVAAAMIAVENSLSEMSSAKAAASIEVAEGVDAGDAALAKMQGAEQQKLMQTVLDEAKVNLARVKDALTEFSNNNEEREQLRSVPALLGQIQGSLMILSLEDAANLLTLTTHYISNKLINETIPPSISDMNNLADAISSLEYYMESLMGNWGQPEAILTVAEQSLQALGINTDVVAEVEEDTQLGVIEEESVEAADVSDNLPEVSNENMSLDDLSLELTDAASSVDDDISLDDITLDEGLEFESEEISADEILTNDEDSITAPPAIEIESIQVPSVAPESVKEPSLLDDTIDDEIIEIFMEEAEEAYETISGLLPGWINNTANDEPLKEMRRAYHTLKGSGRLVGAIDLGEFAWAFENMLNRVLDSTIKVNPEILELMERGKQTLPDLFELFKVNKKPGQSILTLMEYADALSQGKSINIEAEVSDDIQTESVSEIKVESEPEIITLTEINEEPLVEIVEAELPPVDIDTALLDIYRKEVATHCHSLKQYIVDWNNGETEASHILLRALHTLTGSSRTTGVQSVAVVCSHFESYVKHLQDVEAALPQVALTELENTIELIEGTLDCLDQAGAVLPEHETLLSRIDNLPKDIEPKDITAEDIAPIVETNAIESVEMSDTEVAEPVDNNVPLPDYDEELLEIFLEEGTEILEESDQIIHEWISNPGEDEFVKALQRHLHTLKGGARMAGIAELGDLGHSIESLLTAVVDGHMQASKPMFELVQRAQDRLVKMLELVQAHSGLTAATDLINEVDAMLENRGIVSDEEFVFESAVDINNESSLNSSTVELSELEKLEEELRLDSNIEVEDVITLPDLELPDVTEDVANSEIESADVISLDLTNEDQIQKVAEEIAVPDVDKEDEHDRR
ncbi:MAG: Hpt domain-containing protein [Gammaproteobacteria bacterium]|nr:Hpt domain-containing protein [Gammaproteobacteria bacterium]